MRKVFLDTIPKRGTLFDWKNSVGCVVKFIYDDIEGEVKIVDSLTQKRKIILEYNGKIFNERPITHGSFCECGIGYYIGKVTNEFKLDVGQTIKSNNRDITITGHFHRDTNKRKHKYKYYDYKCNKCGNTDSIDEASLLSGTNCNVCANKKVVPGINDIATTDPWMIDLGVSKEDAKKYTKSSGKKVTIKCPLCKTEKSMELRNLYNYKSIGCICSDGISFPEKFIFNLLKQLNVKYIRQLSLDNNCTKYDFCIPHLDMIIETHGMQHYKDNSFEKVGGRTLIEELENDLYKRLLANMWDYNYIELDCRYSDIEWIKQSVKNSRLSLIFDLNNIDWGECGEFASSNLVKQVCDYWNAKQEWETTADVGRCFHLTSNTIGSYLKNGTKIGWCKYDPKEEKRKSSSRSGIKSGKNVSVYKLDGEYVGTFRSATELERISVDAIGTKLYQANISAVILGKVKQHKGYTFRYTNQKSK